MKSNAYLYLPWSVVAEWAASPGQLAKRLPDRFRIALASIEQLGCVLFRLTGSWRVGLAQSSDRRVVEYW
jgi:hypothetical protein